MFDGMQNHPHDKDERFASLQAGPARTLHYALKALRRGDAVLVLTAKRRSERAAMLVEVVRLAGPGLRRTVRIDGAEAGPDLVMRLRREGIRPAIAALPHRLTPPHIPGGARTLLVIDDADMVPASALAMLADMRDEATGVPVQMLLAGSSNLVVTMCAPRCDRLWRRVRLALSLEEATAPASTQIAQLEQEIARTRARLEAQQRILSIFADSDPRTVPCIH